GRQEDASSPPPPLSPSPPHHFPPSPEEALLSIRVADPACGSGAFLLAAARRLGRELARVRTGEEHPTPTAFRRAVRDVIGRCLYGVDLNPLAVDLCKLALWLEGHNRGMPLTFLDHRIRHGDSLVGVLDLAVLTEGIPDAAYQPVSGDDKGVARGLRDQNQQERAGQLTFFEAETPPDMADLAALWQEIGAEPDENVTAIRRKQARYQQARDRDTRWWQLWTACNLWTAPFFATFTLSPPSASSGQAPGPLSQGSGRGGVPTTADVRSYLTHPGAAHGQKVGLANALAVEHPFFHWPLEFPDVFSPSSKALGEGAGGEGFDVILSNPPWERIKLQEQEFFAARDPAIAGAPNKAAREQAIKQLPQTNPALWQTFQAAKHAAESSSRFLRGSDRYPLTARGDVNTYQVFAELLIHLLSPSGRVGVILPTGIVTDFYTQDFFAELVNSQRLQSVVGFENEAFIFPDVHHAFKFCALTIGGAAITRTEPDFVFFCRYFPEVEESLRHFTLTRDDIARINPNTRTCPVFRTRPDAELTRKIYARVPVLENEMTGENPWQVQITRVFDMNRVDVLEQCVRSEQSQELTKFVRMYEAKMVWQFNHRLGGYYGRSERGFTNLDSATLEQLQDPEWLVTPFYFVNSDAVKTKLAGKWEREWLLGFRDITNATNERTFVATIFPLVGTDFTIRVLFPQANVTLINALLANLNSLVLDYVARQSVAGMHLSDYISKQLPVLPPTVYSSTDLAFIVPRVVELVYTAWDLAPFAQDILAEIGAETWNRWFPHNPVTPSSQPSPFIWNEERRAVLRAELDATYARLYGLTEEELRYILDPADVYGEDFPGETFRVLKEKEVKAFGEYRTRRLVLEAWERLKE
ncbi:MAG TPA: hypothetical protein PKH77_24820, partial [Anaerolineae bacterium]|nr:hypothetical protein [Anaerolineae bacterium]